MKSKYLHVILFYKDGAKSYLQPTREFLNKIKHNEKDLLEAREFPSQKEALAYSNLLDILSVLL